MKNITLSVNEKVLAVVRWRYECSGLTAFPCQPIDHRSVRIAIEQSARYEISYWDAAILSGAQALGCRTVYSEDFNDGQQYAEVRVVNPFSSRFAG